MNEKDALRRLSKWLKLNKYLVYQDKKNNNGNPVFHIRGESQKKPDLIIVKKNIVTAVEVKIGNDSLSLRTNSDLVNYFCNYNEYKTFYFDDNNTYLPIDNFVIASYYSPDGYLKKGDVKKNHSEKHYEAYLRGLNPKQEYAETHQIIRGSIWDVIKFTGCYQKYRKNETGIGAVLSTKLDGEKKGIPGFFVMKNHTRYRGIKKTKWWHEWIKL